MLDNRFFQVMKQRCYFQESDGNINTTGRVEVCLNFKIWDLSQYGHWWTLVTHNKFDFSDLFRSTSDIAFH